MEEKTKAQQLVEIANWVKTQNPEFTKHFKTMKAILKVYKELPADFAKVLEFGNLKTQTKKWKRMIDYNNI